MNAESRRRRLRRCILATCAFLLVAALARGLMPGSRDVLPLQSIRLGPSDLPADSRPTEPPEALLGRSVPGHDATPTPAPTQPPRSWPDWVETVRDARLWLSQDPDVGATQLVPRGTPLRVLGERGERFWVYYGGDGGERRAGDGVVEAADVSPSRAPRWVEVRETTALRSGPRAESSVSAWLRKGVVLEVLEDAGKALRVFYRGDGRERDAVDGWVDVGGLVAAGPTIAAETRGVRWLTWSRVLSLRAGDGVWLKVPFRSQLDGSPSAMANCGPASIAMALEFFQVSATTAELRSLTDRLQGTSDPETGVAIEHLQRAVELMGLKGYDLYAGDHFKRWSIEDLRKQLIQGHPVVPQLRFRLMPGRGESDYQEDHYVVLCGVQGDDFIYNDSVDTDGPGYGRVMSADGLTRAWGASYFPFAGFAVGKTP